MTYGLSYVADPRRDLITLQNTASKNELNKDMLKMKKQLEHWQQQAGLSEQQRAMLELSDVTDERAVEE